jgi:hypothetical protein
VAEGNGRRGAAAKEAQAMTAFLYRFELWCEQSKFSTAIGLSTAVLLFVFLTVLSIEHVGMK